MPGRLRARKDYPDSRCLVATNYSDVPKLVGSREHAIAIKLSVHESKSEECVHMLLLPVTYVIYYAPLAIAENESCITNVSYCMTERSSEYVVTVEGLQPHTHYIFRAALETAYNQRLEIPALPGPHAVFKTKAKAPDSVGKVMVEAFSPEEIMVTFDAIMGQEYEVHWRGDKSSSGPLRPYVNKSKKAEIMISKLYPNTKYEISLITYSCTKSTVAVGPCGRRFLLTYTWENPSKVVGELWQPFIPKELRGVIEEEEAGERTSIGERFVTLPYQVMHPRTLFP
ncbi:hypothetical protein SK128_007909 [Halocaridina rubra]|uniref:Fibronectin type-III domain-containing protein n=1 Tax=Halocaridina rubra TaxID=373956 RepID=A0AAN8WP59_HALRR